MPFSLLNRPSIGLSLLKASLQRTGITTDVLYLNLKFAELVGDALCTRVANGAPSNQSLLGDWIFSQHLRCPADTDEYVREVLRAPSGNSDRTPIDDHFLRSVEEMREATNPFLAASLQEVLRRRARIVGFTSVFQQHAASLALAKRIASAAPETFLVFGGANCEGVMGAETLRQFEFVDAVISGEGDRVFVDLVEQVLSGEHIGAIPGVYLRADIDNRFVTASFENAPIVSDMDALPYPDFSDFFEQYGRSRSAFVDQRKPDVLIETSRGCWWGEKHHCTFCGLNGATGMAYRSKSAERALDELAHLAENHPGSTVNVVDNILDLAYFKDLFPALAERDLDLQLFYETKSNIKKSQLLQMHDAGIRFIQPGVESLSTDVLNLMRKGVKAIHNVQLLKWCKELGIQPYWNIIWGFPGESPDSYARMAELARLLVHLSPPLAMGALRLDRFSPNFERSGQLGFAGVTPHAAYQYVYDVEPDALSNLSYFFDYQYQEPRAVEEYTRPLAEAVREWRDVHDSSDLFYQDDGAELRIWDFRPGAVRDLTLLTGAQRDLYLHCDRAQGSTAIARQLSEARGSACDTATVRRALAGLVADGLVLEEDDLFLSLAVAAGTHYVPAGAILSRYYKIAFGALPTPAGPSGDNRTVGAEVRPEVTER